MPSTKYALDVLSPVTGAYRVPGPYCRCTLVQKIAATGGILSHIDLERYKVKVTQALEGTYRGRKVYTTHAPTSGPGEDECIPFLPNCLTKFPVLLHMLNLIEKYDLEKRNGVNTHRFIEAMKFGFAARSVAPQQVPATALTSF